MLILLLLTLSVCSLFVGAMDIDIGTLLGGTAPMVPRIFLLGRIPRLLAILCTGVGMSVAGLNGHSTGAGRFLPGTGISD